MKNKKIAYIVLIGILLLNLLGCTSSQYSASSGDVYSAPAYTDTAVMSDGTTGGSVAGVFSVAWSVIKWPITFLFGIPGATLNTFDNIFSSADKSGLGTTTVTNGY